MSSVEMPDNDRWHLLYDGECPMCGGAVRGLIRLGLISQAQALPWQGSSWDTDVEANEALAERIRTELLVVDTKTGQALGGVQGLAKLASVQARWRWLGFLLTVPGLTGIFSWGYQTIACNRRILSPPPFRAIPCACDPPDNPRARRDLYILLVGIILLDLMLAAVLSGGGGLRLLVRVVLLLATGWLPCYLFFVLKARAKLSDFLRQSLVITAIGTLSLVFAMPAGQLILMMGVPERIVSVIGLGALIVAMTVSLHRRGKSLVWPGWLPWLWGGLAVLACL